jgi:hypothetical protein
MDAMAAGNFGKRILVAILKVIWGPLTFVQQLS